MELQAPDAAPDSRLGPTASAHRPRPPYGLGQPDEARAYYQAVAISAAATILVDLAQAGLKRCEEQPPTSVTPAANTEESRQRPRS